MISEKELEEWLTREKIFQKRLDQIQPPQNKRDVYEIEMINHDLKTIREKIVSVTEGQRARDALGGGE